MNNKQKILPVLITVLILTNITMLIVGNYTFLKLKEAVELQEPISTNNNLIDIFNRGNPDAKEKQVLEVINKLYLREYDEDEVMESKYKGMVDALDDPYSAYMTEDELNDLMIDTDGQFGGIGIVVTPAEDGYITVVSPIEDTPGFEAGIKTGDKIIKVEGEDYFGEDMSEAVKKMRGEPKTEVTITIRRDTEDEIGTPFDLTITRDIITIESVKYKAIDDNIGYIRVTSFDAMTTKAFKDAIAELNETGVEGFIIDLRSNPGGLLDATIDMADEFLSDGIIVYTINKNERETDYFADDKWTDLPLVVIVNGGSASASEIFAGAIKDNNRGMIIGEKTFGKGVVQQIYPLGDGSGIKLTTSEYFTPDGISIHEVGIEPDIEVILDEDIDGIGIDFLDQDNQLQESIKELKELMLK